MRFLLCALLLFACNDDDRDAGPTKDTGTTHDAGIEDVGSSTDGSNNDATAQDATPPDAGTDDSLVGTSLEGIALRWDDALTLCSQWRENRTLEEETAAKVRVLLPAHPRTTMDRTLLEQLSLGDGVIQKSPLAAEQWQIKDLTVQSSVTNWELRNPGGDSSLLATIEHDLGAAGVLSEVISVLRGRTDKSDVFYGADDREVTFFHRTPQGEDILLEPCDAPSLQSQVHALVAENGSETFTLFRFLQTLPSDAGSSPVTLMATAVKRSDRPWEIFSAHGFWPQTYVALHHNWAETSVVDFTNDLSWYQTVYRPYQNGQQVPETEMMTRLAFAGVGGVQGGGSVTVDTLDLQTGSSRSDAWNVVHGWVHVDTESVLAAEQLNCANAEVTTIGWFEYAYHLIRCQPGSSFALDALVIGAFEHDPHRIGERFSGNAISPVTNGFRIDLDPQTLEITTTGQYYHVKLTENGQTIHERLMNEYPLQHLENRDEMISLASADGTVTLELARRWARQGVGESSIYAPRSFTLTFGNETHRVVAWDRLDYVNTHHNWMDSCDATGDGLVMHWSYVYMPTDKYTVSAVRQSDQTVLLPETELFPR